MFRFLIWRGSLCRDFPSAYIVETFSPKQKFTGQYIFASDNLPGKRNFERIPPNVLWRNFRIFQKSADDYFSVRRFFLMMSLIYTPTEEPRNIPSAEKFFAFAKKKLPSYSDESLYRHAYHSNQTPLPHRPL